MLEGVILDLDGTMFDTERHAWQPAWEVVGSELGLGDPSVLYRSIVGLSGEEERQQVRELCGDDVDAEAVVEEATRRAEATMRRGVPLKKGLRGLLAYLEAQGIPMAVGSANKDYVINFLTEGAGIRHYFKALCHGALVERGKPAPDLFLLAADRLGARPARTLVVDDSQVGAQAGLAGGFLTVMVPDIKGPTADLVSRGLHVCQDLDQVREALEAGTLG